MQTVVDYKIQKLKDRMAGRWFPSNRTNLKVNIETIGRSLALTLKVCLLRKMIGFETFSFWNVVWGFVWIRICLVISTSTNEKLSFFQDFLNPYAFNNTESIVLNILSFLFIAIVLWILIVTEFPSLVNGFVNVVKRGESTILKPIINKDKSFLQKEGFVQAVIAPALGLIIGFVLVKFNQNFGLGIYFFYSSFALLIDEVNYHRAKIRLDRIRAGNEETARERKEVRIYKVQNPN